MSLNYVNALLRGFTRWLSVALLAWEFVQFMSGDVNLYLVAFLLLLLAFTYIMERYENWHEERIMDRAEGRSTYDIRDLALRLLDDFDDLTDSERDHLMAAADGRSDSIIFRCSFHNGEGFQP